MSSIFLDTKKHFNSSAGCPADMPVLDPGIEQQYKIGLADVIRVAGHHADFIGLGDGNHAGGGIAAQVMSRENLKGMAEAGAHVVQIEAPSSLQYPVDDFHDGKISVQDFQKSMMQKFEYGWERDQASAMRQLSAAVESARDLGMKVHLSDPQNGVKAGEQQKMEDAYDRLKFSRPEDNAAHEQEFSAAQRSFYHARMNDRERADMTNENLEQGTVVSFYGAGHDSQHNDFSEFLNGRVLRINVYEDDQQLQDAMKSRGTLNQITGMNMGEDKVEGIYVLDRGVLMTTCNTPQPFKTDIEHVAGAPVLPPSTPIPSHDKKPEFLPMPTVAM